MRYSDGLSLSEGYPGLEFQIREALTRVIGERKSALFFDKVCLVVDAF